MQGLISVLLALVLALTLSPTTTIANPREAIEIGIGIGIGGGSPPSPSPSPSPSEPTPVPPPAPPAGGGTNCPPPPSPPPKTPPPRTPSRPNYYPFENEAIAAAYRIIQRFKKTLDPKCDKKGVLKTWNGYKVCNNNVRNQVNVGYRGFYCETPPDLLRRPSDKIKRRRLASIDFNGFNFCGKSTTGGDTIANFVEKFRDLALFHANSNNFNASIPDLTQLRYFYELDVSNNNHTGVFPPAVLRLNLTFLDLRFNNFVGQVPPQAFNIPTQVLFLNNNQFTGSIPYNLGSTPANYITFANNYFTGSIPRSIGQASKTLLEILFLNNQLSGCLPSEIGLLNRATVFDAGFNRITGPIPLSFGCLSKVEQLNLAGNLLYGEVPDSVCRLNKYGGKLANLSLAYNYFTKLGPSCYDLIRRKIICVDKNCIPGLPDQRSPAECAAFLRRPKILCPNVNYVPCWTRAEGGEEDAMNSTAVDGGGGRSYTTYSALHVKDQRLP